MMYEKIRGQSGSVAKKIRGEGAAPF